MKPPPHLEHVSACVFDAYGTLFDISSVARGAQDALGDRWQALSDLWRTKQLQYTWLRGLAGQHADFWQVTGEALDFAMAGLGLEDAGHRHPKVVVRGQGRPDQLHQVRVREKVPPGEVADRRSRDGGRRGGVAVGRRKVHARAAVIGAEGAGGARGARSTGRRSALDCVHSEGRHQCQQV